MTNVFGRFVSAEVRDAIVGMALEDPDLVQPGGRQMEVSVLFADIRGFTTISENLPWIRSRRRFALIRSRVDLLIRSPAEILAQRSVNLSKSFHNLFTQSPQRTISQPNIDS